MLDPEKFPGHAITQSHNHTTMVTYVILAPYGLFQHEGCPEVCTKAGKFYYALMKIIFTQS